MNLAILQARMSSNRLPGKVLKAIVGKPMLELHIERIKRAQNIDKLIVATSNNSEDEAIAQFCQRIGVECYQGSLDNVLERFYLASQQHPASHIIRLTGDCPLACPQTIDQVIAKHIEEQNDFTSNAVPHTFPDGLDVEIMTAAALQLAWQQATTAYHKEHVTAYLYQHPELFKTARLISPVNLNQQRWSVDYPEDFALVAFVYEFLYASNPQFDTAAIIELLAQNPDIFALNQQYVNSLKSVKNHEL
jgi:spore coat polysaccharide biosynthesis protein SpsF